MTEKRKIIAAVTAAVVICLVIGGAALFFRYGGAVDLGGHVLLRDEFNNPLLFRTDTEKFEKIILNNGKQIESIYSIKYTPYLNKFKNLKILSLDIYDDTDTGNIDLSGLDSLEELDIHINRGKYDTDRIYISGFSPCYKKLDFFTVLNFSSLTVSFEGMNADMFPCMETLMITDNSSGGWDGVSSLAGMTTLKSLSLGTRNDISIGSDVYFSNLADCRHLFLVGVRIDDVSEIVNMPSLEEITVSGDRISEENIQRLRDHGVEVEIVQKRGS